LPREKATKQRTNGMTDAYVDWLAECVSVREAYEHWSAARSSEASFAFAVYRAALDREEHASARFAALAS
jgi:hypothetical protein